MAAGLVAFALSGASFPERAQASGPSTRPPKSAVAAACHDPARGETNARVETFLSATVTDYSRKSVVARRIFGQMAGSSPALCLDPESVNGNAGSYFPLGKRIVIWDRNFLANGNTLTHEAMHAAQDKNGNLISTIVTTRAEFVRQSVYMEMAAYAAEAVVALELKQSGDTRLWSYVMQGGKGRARELDKAAHAYDAARAQGHDHDRALEYAGSAAWMAAFDDARLIAHYATKAASEYKGQGVEKASLESGQLQAARMGRIDETLNLTRHVTAPPDAVIMSAWMRGREEGRFTVEGKPHSLIDKGWRSPLR